MNRNEEYARLLLPYDPPLPAAMGGALPSIPHLWERAKLFFSRVIGHIGSTADFSKRWRLTRKEKKEVLGWLEPVEKLARSCLLVRALSFLMMTPEGRRLMRETPKTAMPAPPMPPGKSNPRSTKISLGGWHTHAPYARYLAERRKQEEQRAAERAALDRHDPGNWGGAFRVLHWQFPEPEDGDPKPQQKKLPQWARFLRAGCEDLVILPAFARPLPKVQEKDTQALVLARRIETLSRVISNPVPAIMRLARYIAKLPREALEPLREAIAGNRRHWLHGGCDCITAAAHVRRAASVLCGLDSS